MHQHKNATTTSIAQQLRTDLGTILSMLEHIQKIKKLITNLNILCLIREGNAKLIVNSTY